MIRKIFTLSVFIATLSPSLQAQEASLASGGLATGSGGSVSYSVGQTFYIADAAMSGSLTPGVQQSYHVTPLGITERSDLQISLSVYPNPASENLTITVSGPNTENVTGRIYDLTGKHLETFQVKSGSSQINIGHLSNAIYLFAVAQGNQTIQTFKIVKTH